MKFFKISTLFIVICVLFIACDSINNVNTKDNILSMQPPFLIDNITLEETSNKYNKRVEPIFTFGQKIIKKADLWLDSSYSTIINKKHLPESGDKHDYYSLGPYWWPDITKEDGLPYIRKDGYRNPERLEYDRPKLSKMIEAVTNLTYAYVLSKDDKYKEKIIGFLKTWFINKETKMNPNLEHGQAIPGITAGRGIGIIETRRLIEVVDAIGILYQQNAFEENDYLQLKKWFREYTSWLTTSQKGIDEKNWHNNHGTAYDLQVISFSLFTGDTVAAISVLDSVISNRIIPQIEPDGKQPFELERTKSLSYSIFNLNSLVKIALIAEKLGKDFWQYKSDDDRSITKAINFLTPFIFEDKEWKYPELTKLNQIRIKFLEVINIANHKNVNLNFDKYLKNYDMGNYEVQKEILLRPKNIL